MQRGSNTGNTLDELLRIHREMKSGGFNFDGRYPDEAISEVQEDIIELQRICTTQKSPLKMRGSALDEQ